MIENGQMEEGFGIEPAPNGEWIVVWVNPNGPAERAGMNEGDVLETVNGLSVVASREIKQETDALQRLSLRSLNGARRLIDLAFSTNWVDSLFLVLNFLQVAGFSIVGLLIFLRRSDDWLAILVSLGLITWGVGPMIFPPLWALQLINFLYYGVGITSIFLFFGLFPDGRFTPRWAPLICLTSSAWYLARLFPIDPTFWDSTLVMAINSGLLLAGLGIQIIRYRRTSDLTQHQQTKWVVLAIAIPVIYSVGIFNWLEASGLHRYFITTLPLAWVLLVSLQHLSLLITPVMIGWSILHYHLWDIDVVINRALVYSGLTAILGFIGLLVLPLATALVRTFTADTSPFVAVFITALPMAAVFKPLLERMQHWVDRYFKPEDISFRGSFVEFNPGVHELLTVSELTTILAAQLESQLHIQQATIYLKNLKGNLEQVMPPAADHPLPLELPLPELTRLQRGNMLEYPPNSPFSLLVPLTVKRAQHPDFIGVVALGKRWDGAGNSRLVKKGLAEIGQEAGVAIYIAQLRQKAAMSTKRQRAATGKRSVKSPPS